MKREDNEWVGSVLKKGRSMKGACVRWEIYLNATFRRTRRIHSMMVQCCCFLPSILQNVLEKKKTIICLSLCLQTHFFQLIKVWMTFWFAHQALSVSFGVVILLPEDKRHRAKGPRGRLLLYVQRQNTTCRVNETITLIDPVSRYYRFLPAV